MMIIAGTGHRPKYLPCKYKDPHPWLDELRDAIRNQLQVDQPDIVIAGGAIGMDTWLAEEALKLDISLHLYLPFKGQGDNWPKKTQETYRNILSQADKVLYSYEEYNKDCFHHRDRAMVEAADKVYSLLRPDFTSGGTFYTVSYANKHNVLVQNFWIEC